MKHPFRSPLFLAPLLLPLLGSSATAQFGPLHWIADSPVGNVHWVHAADLTGDGNLDVIAVRSYTPALIWLRNLGGGQFGPPQVLEQFAYDGQQALTMDVNDDGELDILATLDFYHPDYGPDPKIYKFINQGGGAFIGGTNFWVHGTDNPVIAVGDLDRNGLVDLFEHPWSGSGIRVARNLGGGSFAAPQVLTEPIQGLRAFIAVDLDGDGDLDFLIARYNSNEVAWFENLGGSIFGPKQILNAEAQEVSGIDAIDLDGDGLAEPISVSTGGPIRRVHYYPNLGGGSFGPAQVITEGGYYGRSVVGTDLDGDGVNDVVVVEGNGASWYPNDGTATFGPRQVIEDQIWALHMVVADLNGDGAPDVLMGGPDGVFWRENQLAGSLGSSYCGPAVPNSTGLSGEIGAVGSFFVGLNDLELVAQQLPAHRWGIFIASATQGLTPSFGGIGTLCLAPPIRRISPMLNTAASGTFALQIDLTQSLGGPVLPGSSWFFQAWHRDSIGSNMTDGLRIDFAP